MTDAEDRHREKTIGRKAAQGAAVAPDRFVLDSETERAARTFMRRLAGRYPVREAIVFGSRARGAHGPDSDVDVAVVLRGARGDRVAVALDMAGIAFDVLLETGLLIEALPLWESELDHPETFRNRRLLDNIRREGARV
jgi:predicted nucleotidyltransferase